MERDPLVQRKKINGLGHRESWTGAFEGLLSADLT